MSEAKSIIRNINSVGAQDSEQNLTRNLQGLLYQGAPGYAGEYQQGLPSGEAPGEDLGHERAGEGIPADTGTPAQPEASPEREDPCLKLDPINASISSPTAAWSIRGKDFKNNSSTTQRAF